MDFFTDMESSIKMLFTATNDGFRHNAEPGQQQVGYWIDRLRDVQHPALGPIVAELNNLQQHLGHNDAAGMAVAFQNLGELSARAAHDMHSFGGAGDKLRELSQKLITAAGNLRLVARTQTPVVVAAH